MKPAGGAGRREGMHMVHTFGEIRTRTPANPREAAEEAIMPQAASEALLRDAVQGLRPPYTPRTLRQWLQATHYQAWATSAPPPTRPPPQRQGKGQDKGCEKGTGGEYGRGARKRPR